MRQKILSKTLAAGILVLLGTTALAGCQADAAVAPTSSPSATVRAETPSSTPAPTPTTSARAEDTLDGTWCRAADPTACMTVADGATGDGATVAEADSTESAPCAAYSVSDTGGGFVVYFCPTGVTPDIPVVVDTDSSLVLDNLAYDRLFATQNPPYVDTWYRQDELAAAVAG